MSANFGGISINNETDLENTTFVNNKEYWIFSTALDQKTTPLTISGISGSTICFADDIGGAEAKLEADVEFSPASAGGPNVGYGDDYGVVNIVNCTSLKLVDLDVTNTRQYVTSPVTLRKQSSCALNISGSTVEVINAKLTGKGKSVVLIHDNSDVTIKDSEINGYYFELNVGASDVTVENTVLNQNNTVTADSHAAINATAAYGSTNGGPASANPTIQLTDVTFNMTTGRAIVTGSTNDFSKVSTLTLTRPVFNISNSTKGLVGYHANWMSIEVILDQPITGLVDYTTANTSNPITGFGRFVNYYSPPQPPQTGTTTISDGLSIHSFTITP